jgi:hypothetical protein
MISGGTPQQEVDMPGFLTHYLSGQAILARLPEHLHIPPAFERIFTLGTQGPDIFFYYAPGFLRAKTRGVGSVIHHGDFGPFFMHMTRWARHETVFAYLAGFLAHYTLDIAAHPFVNAQTTLESAMQTSAAHRHFETVTDVLMLARLKGIKPADICQHELIEAPREHKLLAAIPFSEAVRKVYHRELLPQDVFRAMGYMAKFTRLLGSPTGRRKQIAAFIEDKTVNARILSAMVHMQEVTDDRDWLNLSRTYWGANTTRCESFPELFDSAVNHALELITALDAYRNANLPRRELAELIGNHSLSVGLIN